MNKETPYRDQAERTRKKIVVNNKNTSPGCDGDFPPRSRLHNQRKHKTNLKLKFPMIRLLVLFFILLPISIYSGYNYLTGEKGENEKGIVKTEGYEKINIETTGLVEKPKKTNEPVRFEEKDITVNTSNVPATPAPLAEDSNPVDSKNMSTAEPETEVANQTYEQMEKETTANEQPNQDEQEPLVKTEDQAEGEIVYHTVQKGENLFRISLKYFQSQQGMEIIRKANNLQGDEIQLGQVLKIPIAE
ncbi:LysM peptidoglycan-binding domain-containing protein [Mesobacillus maritimus]|uniref:LysM peptidoglycan-binding domain-containing protein n=1 Tax=Mesobacillus maritimus TaxID=1643336 RepID=UPI002042240A|nr:LysM peptidoglycan-binding domain-containing protein [Mesobacillus maritimus]MCM3669495.1 LysM peptidoglycan-binding domain-containing protein [Mesobacillus maritimus]